MDKRIVLVHAVMAAMGPVADAFRELWPAADCVNVLDDALPRDLEAAGGLSGDIVARFGRLGDYAASISADGLLFTCSAFGPAIDAVARAQAFPVLKPNEAMFEAALGCGKRIGMLATFAPSVPSMESEFAELTARRGVTAELETVCVPEAMDALRRGDTQAHNSLLAQAAPRLAHCDAVMLAQFSTSRAEGAVAERLAIPVLTAPKAAVRQLQSRLSA
jgi:Asp/Glu/hydantoin racemase